MSMKGEKYKSAKAKKMHEKGEGPAERFKEYGKKGMAPPFKPKAAKRGR